eukprot:TRINITY_DN55274_c0_g1_i1.p1 TRINITY_DN55274_c0_g1~~TRINITY_DN55274_c0_g1_i1.p1  ORF type:complete len:430 (+),score=61.65 TRINITY_DN55274_c0_g1_i1:115-1404(+)
MLRISVVLNSGPRKGRAQPATVVVPPQTEAILTAAANKLQLKKKEVACARLFVRRNSWELPRNGTVDQHLVLNDDVIAITLGEPFVGPSQPFVDATLSGENPAHETTSPVVHVVSPPPICGADDVGRNYASLVELWADQARRHESYHAANDSWWDADGYGGSTDEEAMIGDEGSSEDVEHSLQFLDSVRAAHPQLQIRSILDGGAGIGRVTKHVLLRRSEHVCLLEPCERWLKQSRRYLGNKRSLRCTFMNCRLEQYEPSPRHASFDIIWIQWALQYLVDACVVAALRRLTRVLSPCGVFIIKENRPLGLGKEEVFQVDTPEGPHGRYDVTRPDAHHRWLFRCASLIVKHWEHAGECTAWVLRPAVGNEVEESEGLVAPSMSLSDEAANVGSASLGADQGSPFGESACARVDRKTEPEDVGQLSHDENC